MKLEDTRGEWAWGGYFLICSNVKAKEGELLGKQSWIFHAILRTNSVISGKKSLDFVLGGPSFDSDKWRVPLGSSVIARRQGFPRHIVPTSYILDSNCGSVESRPCQLRFW